MEFIKKLKTKSIIRSSFLALLIALIAVIFLVASQCWLFWQTPTNLYDVPREDLEGAYVTVELPFIYASYAYTEEYESNLDTSGTIVAMEYIIDANPEDYCGLLIEDDELIAQADALLEQSYQYSYYEIDEITATFTVTGIMEKMPDDSLDFYHEIVGYDQLTSRDKEIYLPLYLNVRDGNEVTSSVILMVAAAGFLLWAVIVLIRAITGAHQKQLLKKAQQLSPSAPDMILDQLDQLNASQPKEKFKINERLVFVHNGNIQRLYATNELVWAYHSVTTQRVYFIPVGKSHSLTLAMIDGKSVQVPMPEAKIKDCLQTIQQIHPSCFLGFNQEIAKIYRRNPASLPQIRAAQMDTPQQ